MDLDRTDLRYLALLAGADRDFVESKLRGHPVRLEAMSPVAPLPALGGRLLEYVKLVARAVQGCLRPSPAAGFDSVAFDRFPATVPSRLEYLAYFAPVERVWGVGHKAPPCSRGSIRRTARVLAGLLPLVARASRDSSLAPHYISAARMCLRIGAAASATTSRTAHVFRAYRLETALLSAYLRDAGIRVNVIVEATPIAAYNRRLLADVVTLASPYQIDEARVYAADSRVGEYRFWGPTQAPLLDRTYTGRRFDDLPGVVGVYTQGYWLRLQEESVDAESAASMLPLEVDFARIVSDLARAQPDVRFIVFPHPMERRYHAETGDRGPARFAGLPNVEYAGDDSADSAKAFDLVGLGITTLSTVGFDRLYMGFRSLFYFGGATMFDRSVPSEFDALFFDDEEGFRRAFERERTRGHEEFMRAYFAPDAHPGWLPAGPGLPRRDA